MSARTRHLFAVCALLPMIGMAVAVSGLGLATAGCAKAEANRLAVTYYYLPG